MALTLPDASMQAACDAVVDRADTGTGTPTLRFFLEVQTGDTDTPPATAICDCAMDGTAAFGAATTAGVATAAAIADGTCSAGGTIQSALILDRDDAVVVGLSVGLVASGADIELTSVAYLTNDIISMTSLTVTMPQAQA
jgi:hypothetical protein